MNYLLYLFLSKLPCCLEKKMLVDGKEEICLVLPTKENQIKRGKQGNWMMMCRLAELPPNAKGQTHEVQLSYLTEEEVQKSYDFGYHKRTARMGHVYEHDRTPEKKIDRTNNASDIRLDGCIVLSDIPKELLFKNAENAKYYLSNLAFRGVNDDGYIYTGSICVSDIPKEDINIDPDTGKKFIKARLRKMEKLDTYFNTHELVIARPDGESVQIGLFKEWRKEGYVPPQNPQCPMSPSEPQKKVPDSIQGIRF